MRLVQLPRDWHPPAICSKEAAASTAALCPVVVDSANAKLTRDQAIASWSMVIVSLIGFALRAEHTWTFDGPLRGADYAVNVDGIRWMIQHHRPFDFTPQVSVQ